MRLITTIPPYAPFLDELGENPEISGFRLNTVMPVVHESLEEMLQRLRKAAHNKPLWIDLKCRQLRTSRGVFYNAPEKPIAIEVEGKTVVLDPSSPKSYGELRTPPWAVLEIDHEIELDTSVPVRCYMNDGYDKAFIVRVDGNRLIMLDGPQKVIGGGESINITHPSLKIKGFLTENDARYIEAGKKAGIHTYMLSYLEQNSDISDLLSLDPDAQVVAKIESEKGLDWVEREYPLFRGKGVSLMCASGDLFVEVERPHKILNATRDIIEADHAAIAASRLFTSLRSGPYPAYQDIMAVGMLLELGYRNFMIGDDICFRRESLTYAVNLFRSIKNDYIPR